MGNGTLREHDRSYRQLSSDELIDIYLKARQAGDKRDTDPDREPWSWRAIGYALAAALVLGLILIQLFAG